MLNTEWDFDTAIAVAKEESWEDGVEEGLQKGIREGVLRTAKAMKDEGYDVGTIARITKLSIDTILRL